MNLKSKSNAGLAPTIITGKLKGLKLKVPDSARPFTGRVKHSVFDTLQNYLQEKMIGAQVLDLFAGSGNLGLEALSRGAGHATFVEINRKSAEIINENIINAKIGDSATVIQRNVVDFLREDIQQYDLIFIDPPFAVAENLSLTFIPKVLANGGVVVLKMPRRHNVKIPTELRLGAKDEIGTNEVWYLVR